MNNYIKKIILITDYLSIFTATYLTALIENIVISKIIMFFILFIFIFIEAFFLLLENYSYINKFLKPVM